MDLIYLAATGLLLGIAMAMAVGCFRLRGKE